MVRDIIDYIKEGVVCLALFCVVFFTTREVPKPSQPHRHRQHRRSTAEGRRGLSFRELDKRREKEVLNHF